MKLPDVSEREIQLRKLDRRDKNFRAFELFILFALILFNIFVGYILLTSIQRNERNALQARQSIISQQGEIQRYLKCILLLKYDVSSEQLTTRGGTETAIDTCAKNENSSN